MIEISGIKMGFQLNYELGNKMWITGYKSKNINVTTCGKDINEAIEKLFDKLKEAATYKSDTILNKLDNLEKEFMKTSQSTKEVRHKMYEFIEKLLDRKLSNEEKSELSHFYMDGVKTYTKNIFKL